MNPELQVTINGKPQKQYKRAILKASKRLVSAGYNKLRDGIDKAAEQGDVAWSDSFYGTTLAAELTKRKHQEREKALRLSLGL